MDAYDYDFPPITPLTAAQFKTILDAAYLAESMDLVAFDADLRGALNAISKPEAVS
jgi:hypothetical protein